MKTVRVLLDANEVTEALTRFAYFKSGRDEPCKTGPVETLLMLGQDANGGTIIKQCRVEIQLPAE